jgi:phospholipase C
LIMLKMTMVAVAALVAGSRVMAATPHYGDIQTVVVIYAENRSFDNLFGGFPGADGLTKAPRRSVLQMDRDGKPMRGLPAIWGAPGTRCWRAPRWRRLD